MPDRHPGAASAAGEGDGRGRETAAGRAKSLRLDRIERHVFLCSDATKPKCCDPERARAAWRHLKSRLDELGLAGGEGASGTVARTRANCLRVCADGPVAVVYPDGVWYAKLDPPAIDRVVREHLIGGVPVEDFRIRIDPATEDEDRESPGAAPTRAAG